METLEQVDAFKTLRLFLRAYGIYEVKEGNLFKRMHYYIVVTICIISTIGHGGGAIFSDQTLSDRCVSLICVTESSIAAVKVSVLYWNKKDLDFLLRSLKDYMPQTALGRTVRRLLSIYAWTMTALIASWVLTPIVLQQRRTPMAFWVPFDTSNSWVAFVPVYLLASLCLMCECHIQTTMENMTMLLSSQIAHRLYLLRLSLENLGAAEQSNTPGIITSSSPLKTLSLCTDEHNLIMRLVESFEKLVSIVFLIQVVISTIVIGIAIFSASTLETSLNEIVKYIPIFIILYTQLFMYCWSGENIITYCENLHFGCYSSIWYTLPLEYRKRLVMLQIYSAKPILIKGGYIFDMALRTFLSCVQQSFSYFMILHQFAS